MREVDLTLAEMLRDVLDVKIRKCRKEMLDTYQQIQVERIQAQIMAYQWVQDRLQDLVINNNKSKNGPSSTYNVTTGQCEGP